MKSAAYGQAEGEAERQARLTTLTSANLGDLYRAFAVPPALRPLAAPVLRPFAQRFAVALTTCDRLTAELGLQRAMAQSLEHFGVSVQTFGVEGLPTHGPLLITSNHPGLTDAPALLASFSRPDLYILSARRSLLEALPTIYNRLIVVDEANPRRTVRAVVRHLRAGGALLTFPAGRIESDPALGFGAAEASLATWSPSIETFVRLAPDTQVVPAIVSGVTTPETLEHPLMALHRSPQERAWLAASLQMMFPRYQHNRVAVHFASPLRTTLEARALFADVLRQSRALIVER